eukprot:scaffold595685_cov42-Prasinocladus_malaysianus.AAC.1
MAPMSIRSQANKLHDRISDPNNRDPCHKGSWDPNLEKVQYGDVDPAGGVLHVGGAHVWEAADRQGHPA